MNTREYDTEPETFSDPAGIEPGARRKARCLNCGFLWTPKNKTAMEPPRCPDCFSRKTVWEDEYLSLPEREAVEDIQPVVTQAPVVSSEVIQPAEREDNRNLQPAAEPVKETPEPANTQSSISSLLILLILGAGGYFLYRSIVKKPDSASTVKKEAETAIQKPVIRPCISAIVV